jgi:hypothetical protein
MLRWAILAIIFVVYPPVAARAQQALESSIRFYYFDFKEDCPPPLKSTEEAWLLGSRLSYCYRGEENNLYGRLLFEYARANTDYDGTDQEGIPLTGEAVNTFLTGEAALGYRFANPLVADSHLVPYTGIGYRFRDRDLGVYSEEYDWLYMPLGLRMEFQPSPRWEVALDLALRFVVNAAVKVNLSEIALGLADAEARLDDQIGFIIALPVSYRFHPQWSLTVTPWHENINLGLCPPFPVIRNGQAVGSAHVPESETIQYGANVGLVFWF